MPLFTYRCDTCDYEDDIIHSRMEDLSDEPCLHAPECPGTLKKLLNAVPFRFSTGRPTHEVIHHD